MKIVVLAGGLSPEREVSLTSGSLIANALMRRGHRVLLLDVYEGIELLPLDLNSLFRANGSYEYTVKAEIPDLDTLRARVKNGDALVGRNVEIVCHAADKVFLALHGAMGENGQIQAYLDACGISYTGSGYVGCLLSMDKDISKRLLRDAGVPTPKWLSYDPKTDRLETVLSEIGLPCVVKPCGCGSSVGVSIVETEAELKTALTEAAKWDSCVLVEEKIEGRELTMGVLGSQALPPVEIIPKEGFYDYKNKYRGETLELCPAPITKEQEAELSMLTLRAFDALHLKNYARFDYILDPSGKFWCLEGNSLPGMTPTSLLPQEAAAVGMSYEELCELILTSDE